MKNTFDFPEVPLIQPAMESSNRAPETLTPNACKPQRRGYGISPQVAQFSFHYNTRTLLAHGARATLAGVELGGLGLGHTLGQDLGVLVLLTSALATWIF